MTKIRNLLEKINIRGRCLFDVSLDPYTSFHTGGPADVLIFPEDMDEGERLIKEAHKNRIPCFILGGGANLLVADRGIRGIVLSTARWTEVRQTARGVYAEAGIAVDQLEEILLDLELSGMEFLSGMPGSLGGALFMNARCYGASLSDILISVDYLEPEGSRINLPFRELDWGYKKSPFQKKKGIILGAEIRLTHGNRSEMAKRMNAYRDDRKQKGHYRFPCAGSTFKNNRKFGMPSGKIIDKAGLLGLELGGAQVAEYHGNILINKGSATSEEILRLMEKVRDEVYSQTGFLLEPEIVLAGEWEKDNGKLPGNH